MYVGRGRCTCVCVGRGREDVRVCGREGEVYMCVCGEGEGVYK